MKIGRLDLRYHKYWQLRLVWYGKLNPKIRNYFSARTFVFILYLGPFLIYLWRK